MEEHAESDSGPHIQFRKVGRGVRGEVEVGQGMICRLLTRAAVE